jgi:uncharacterized protein YgiM (DUF1202 family)
MVSGRLFLSATLSLAACSAIPPVLCAQDAAQGELTGKKIQGVVNANAVYVRSRASEDAYPTMMLKKGDEVTVVGAKSTWLKIVPPDKSFAYVPKSYVNMHGDGTVGTMQREWIARVGSSLNELAAEPMATVHQGEEVQIIGQHNEYFEIKPPKDSYLWVAKQFVDPKPETLVDNTPKETEKSKTDDAAPPTSTTPDPKIAEKNTDTGPTTKPTPQVADATGGNEDATPPATQPARFDAIAEYDALEKEFTETAKKPILEQPLPDLIARYQKVIAADDLPSSMRQIAQIRVASLQARNDAREKFLAVQNDEKKMAEKQKSLVAERQEIEDRIKQNNLEIFVAVGTLRTSSLQIGQSTLYRLTDPATGRTVAYIRTNDPNKYGGMLGQFIGVRGPVTNDAQLKTIIENPSEAKPVDPDKVNRSIAAQFVPPSLVKFAATPTGATPPKETDNQASVDKDEPPQQD